MLDWKILAASFAALLFVSSLLIGDFAIKDFFTGIADKLSEWLGNSPFGGMFTAPTPSNVISTDSINVKIIPDTFTLKPDLPVNVSFSGKIITDFSGEILVDYNENEVILDESNSNLNIVMPVETIEIHGLNMKKLLIQNTGIDADTGNWELATDNGTIEIYDFSGSGEIGLRSIDLVGNITRLIRL